MQNIVGAVRFASALQRSSFASRCVTPHWNCFGLLNTAVRHVHTDNQGDGNSDAPSSDRRGRSSSKEAIFGTVEEEDPLLAVKEAASSSQRKKQKKVAANGRGLRQTLTRDLPRISKPLSTSAGQKCSSSCSISVVVAPSVASAAAGAVTESSLLQPNPPLLCSSASPLTSSSFPLPLTIPIADPQVIDFLHETVATKGLDAATHILAAALSIGVASLVAGAKVTEGEKKTKMRGDAHHGGENAESESAGDSARSTAVAADAAYNEDDANSGDTHAAMMTMMVKKILNGIEQQREEVARMEQRIVAQLLEMQTGLDEGGGGRGTEVEVQGEKEPRFASDLTSTIMTTATRVSAPTKSGAATSLAAVPMLPVRRKTTFDGIAFERALFMCVLRLMTGGGGDLREKTKAENDGGSDFARDSADSAACVASDARLMTTANRRRSSSSSLSSSDHIVETTGARPGAIRNCKVGDIVVTMGPSHIARGRRIVLEAKADAAYTLPRALEEISLARKNRGANCGIFVFLKGTEPDSLAEGESLKRYGRDLIVVWDPDDEVSHVYVDAALSIGTALLVGAGGGGLCASSSDDPQLQRSSSSLRQRFIEMRDLIHNVEYELKAFSEIRKFAETAQSANEKIIQKCKLRGSRALALVEELNLCVSDAQAIANKTSKAAVCDANKPPL